MLFVIFLGFNRAKHIANAILQFEKQTIMPISVPIEKVIVNARYPLPSRQQQELDFRKIARLTNSRLIELPENYGQTRNMSLVHSKLPLKPWDMVLHFDSDVAMNKPTWLLDFIVVCQAGYDLVTCGCFHNVDGDWVNIANFQGERFTVHDIKCRETTWPGGYPIGLFSGRYAMEPIRNLHKYYGATEYDTVQHLKRLGLKGALLEDYVDNRNHSVFDEPYARWKAETIHLREGPNFDEAWLKEKGYL